MVWQLIQSPRAFMERKVGQPKMGREILTVLVVGALGALGTGYVGQQILGATEADSVTFPVLGIILKPILGAVLLWVAYAVALHVLANYFNGRGPIRRLLKVTAWALIPIGLGNLLRSGSLFLTFQTIDVANVLSETSGTDPVQAVMAAGTSDLIYAVGTLLLLATVLWTGHLLTFAVQNAKNLSSEKARKAAVLPVGVHILYLLWDLAGSFGIVG